jgi:hypothetical protein
MGIQRSLQALGCAVIAALALTAVPASAQDRKPNVVFILADNVGYGAGNCAARRRQTSTNWLAKDCG